MLCNVPKKIPVPGPPILDPVLANNDWDTISYASENDLAASTWSVGDTKPVTINGAVGNTTFSNLTLDAYIIGINHNESIEGKGIHFKLGKISGTQVALCDSKYDTNATSGYFVMNTTNTNSGGWNGSYMRKTILGNSGTPSAPPSGSLLAALSSDLLAVMKPATKYSDNTGGGSNTASYVTSTTDYLFLLAEFELYGNRTIANSAEQNYQTQYDYYKAGNSKIHYNHSDTATAVYTWLRSVKATDSMQFCLSSKSTTEGSSWNPANSNGISPAFIA